MQECWPMVKQWDNLLAILVKDLKLKIKIGAPSPNYTLFNHTICSPSKSCEKMCLIHFPPYFRRIQTINKLSFSMEIVIHVQDCRHAPLKINKFTGIFPGMWEDLNSIYSMLRVVKSCLAWSILKNLHHWYKFETWQ